MVAAVESMVYVADRGTPWHRQGNPVNGLMTADEALVESGLDWEVNRRNLKVVGGEVLPDTFANVRSTDGAVLGVVGDRYRIIQNKAAFDFADALVDSGDAKFETAGSLFGGKRVFLSMELAHLGITVPGDDSETKMYLLLSNGHDGKHGLEADITPVRVVCANTLNAGQSQAVTRFKMRHSGSIDGKLIAAREALGIAFKVAEDFSALAERLALKKVVDQQVLDILTSVVFPMPEDISDEAREDHPAMQAYANYLTSETVGSTRGTAWGALNGIGEFIDYGVTYRGRSSDAADVRTKSLLWGPARDKKDAAVKALLAL